MLLTLAFPLLLLGGMAIAAQSSINGTLSVRTDVVTTAWLTNVVASVILLLLVVFFEPPQVATMFNVPTWQLAGALFGNFSMVAIVIAVPRIGTAATIVAIIAGQIIMGLLVDHLGWFGNTQIVLDYKRMAAIALLAGALYLIYLSNVRRIIK
ncbi:DMT family transporter [Psychrobacter sp. DAB_AL62B]|uniref:DMT family transporter n=1 Tax=Psychrobacter sp. DAB_AL62B TaxID=1028420 RepID=UPI0023813E44|nr:DMT family transporter [Psychrobacter sp. DAB_AL62B]MDE4454153.1 DMT family transporter [Psychrobacter sp. DAB_AL62B]